MTTRHYALAGGTVEPMALGTMVTGVTVAARSVGALCGVLTMTFLHPSCRIHGHDPVRLSATTATCRSCYCEGRVSGEGITWRR